MAKKKQKEKIAFSKKVDMVFKNPVRMEIVKELSNQSQRPKDLAKNIGVQKQSINYHLNTLKKGGIIKPHTKFISKSEFNPKNLPDMRGIKVNGLRENGKIKISKGIELTKNGKAIANEFIIKLSNENKDYKLNKKDII